MEIPILHEGENIGTLRVEQDACFAVMDARLRDVGSVLRLRVFGENEAWYLGVPEPEDGQLRLTRRVSPARMRGFPANPLYAAERRQKGDQSAREPVPAAERGPHVLWLGGRPFYF